MNIEPLEARIAPAAVTVSYTDIDGDLVKITDSSGHLTKAANLIPLAVAGGSNDPMQLKTLELTSGDFTGANITFAVTKGPHGDGLAAVGYIHATGVNLGNVKVVGDLGAIDAGDGNAVGTPAVKSLTVNSMGIFGTATGAPDLHSDIKGTLGALTVTTDVKDAFLFVATGVTNTALTAKIGAVKIGGSLVGGLAANSGEIFAYGGIASVTIGGNVVGGADDGSGTIVATDGEIGNVTIGGSLIGGAGEGSGEIFNLKRGIGAVKIGGNLKGDIGPESGKIDVKGNILSLTVGGSILGGAGADNTFTDTGSILHAGQVFAGGTIGPVTIAHDLHGGAGDSTGAIKGIGGIGAVTIGGSVLDGLGLNSGMIDSGFTLGLVKIGHDVRGNTNGGGRILSSATIAGVTIGGSLIGGGGLLSGVIDALSGIGAVKIGHDVLGGGGGGSGRILASSGTIASVTIGGSLIGGPGGNAGGIDAASIGPIKIGRDLIGANLGTGGATMTGSGYIRALAKITSVEIGGSIITGIDSSSAGDLVNNASIRSDREIGSITVKGDLAGNAIGVNISPVIISAGGALDTTHGDVAIGKITVGHRVEQAKIFAGYDDGLAPKNADAGIGAVTVGGDWIASNLVAGAINKGNDNTANTGDDNQGFGDSLDAKITGTGTIDNSGLTAKIASVSIKGRVMGNLNDSDSGFVAEKFGTVKFGGVTVPLGVFGGAYRISGLTNVAVHEISSLFPIIAILGFKTQRVGNDTITYGNANGGVVTVKLSKPLLTSDAIANSVFKFHNGVVGDFALTTLEEIDLTPLATDGLSITVTVQGKSFADIGYINAGTHSIGAVIIPGDLGSIDAASVTSLKAYSMGRFGLITSGTHTADLTSTINGPLGALTVTGDVKDVIITVAGSATSMIPNGTIGTATIGGSVIGARISANDALGVVKIGSSLVGGASSSSGVVRSEIAGIKSVTIGGSVLGGVGQDTGEIRSPQALGAVKIGGNFVGGTSQDAGAIVATGTVGAVSIGGSLLGGSGSVSGYIQATGQSPSITVAHNLRGGTNSDAGKIGGAFKAVTVGGSVIGGTAANTGYISANGSDGSVKIGHNVLGGSNTSTGKVSPGNQTSVTISGSLVGGTGGDSGEVTGSSLGGIKIGHDLTGGSGGNSGYISAGGAAPGITIGGSLVGGSGFNKAGSIFIGGILGPVKIGRDLLGGSISGSQPTADLSGSITSAGRISSVTIAGSIIAGFDTSGSGVLTGNASIRSALDLGALTVTGSIVGRSTASAATPIFITARHQFSSDPSIDLVIGKVTVGGLVSLANIEAGYDYLTLAAQNANAQIGAVAVKGNWVASNLIAGAENLGANNAPGGGDDNLNFGDSHDRIIGAVATSIAKIASITIGGSVAGTAGGSDHFGFVSRTIGSFKTAGFTAPLTAAINGRLPIIVGASDVDLDEV